MCTYRNEPDQIPKNIAIKHLTDCQNISYELALPKLGTKHGVTDIIETRHIEGLPTQKPL